MTKYIIISPVKNEDGFIKRTLESVCSQSLLPSLWLILNDNSIDNTEEIVLRYASKYSWIKLININDIKLKEYSSRVAYLINYGSRQIKNMDYDFIVKLDSTSILGIEGKSSKGNVLIVTLEKSECICNVLSISSKISLSSSFRLFK